MVASIYYISIYYNSSKWLGLSSGGRLHIYNIHIIYIYTCSSRCAWCDLNWMMWWNVRCIRFTHTHTTHRHTFCAAVASCCIQIFRNWLHATTYIERYMYRVNFKTIVGGIPLLSPVNRQENNQQSIKDIMIIKWLGVLRSIPSRFRHLHETFKLHCSYNEVNI